MCKKRFGDAENRRTFTALLKAKQQGSCDIKKEHLFRSVLHAAALLLCLGPTSPTLRRHALPFACALSNKTPLQKFVGVFCVCKCLFARL